MHLTNFDQRNANFFFCIHRSYPNVLKKIEEKKIKIYPIAFFSYKLAQLSVKAEQS